MPVPLTETEVAHWQNQLFPIGSISQTCCCGKVLNPYTLSRDQLHAFVPSGSERQRGANTAARNLAKLGDYGWMPFAEACHNAISEIVKLLLDSRADTEIADAGVRGDSGGTPMM